jgi:hypothetical protein
MGQLQIEVEVQKQRLQRALYKKRPRRWVGAYFEVFGDVFDKHQTFFWRF